jgi:preprotein translocase subunit SecD
MTSSDYISRLRGELLRAAAQEPAHRPARALRRFRPVVVAAALAAVVVAVALTFTDGTEREVAADGVRLEYRVEPAAAAEDTAACLRDRLDALGVEGATVTATPGGVTVTAPVDVTALTQPGRFAIYDWESSVLGPRGRPAPDDERVTGGEGAGQMGALTQREAEERGPAFQTPEGGWFALGGTPALTNADIARASAATDPMNDEPIVVVDLTAEGERAFRELTRDVAHRGADFRTDQHIAITLDDRLASVPYISWREAPDGLDGPVQISGGLTPESARQLAAILSSGPLPATLSRG